MTGSELLGLRYEPPFPYITDYGERGHTVLAGDFVTIEDGTGVVHTGAAFGEDDFRLATENGLTIHNPVRPTAPSTSARARSPGMYVRDADAARSSRRCASPGACSAPASTSTPIRTAGAAARRSSTTRSAAGTCARPRSGTSCSRPTRRSPGTPSTSSTAASATGSRTTWTGRSRASATGARRCRSGAASEGARGVRRLAGRARERGGEVPEDLHRPYIDEVVLALRGLRRRDAPRARADRRLVGLRLHAVRAVARAVRERGHVRASASPPTTSARRSTRRAAGSTRCSRSRRCCSGRAVRDVPLPRPDPRPRGPEDVEVEGQRGGALGRDRTRTARTRSAGTTSPRSSRGTATASRWRRWASRCASSCKTLWNTYGFYVLYANVTDDRRARASPDRPRPLDALAPRPTDRARDRADGGLRHDVRRPRDRRVRRRSLQLVRAPLAAALLGRRPGGVRDAARVAAHGGEAAGAAHAVHRRRDLREPRRLRAVGAPLRLPGAGRARRGARVAACRWRATRWSWAARRARTRR